MSDVKSDFTQHTIDQWLVAGSYQRRTTQMTLTLSGHFGQDMAFVSAFSLPASGCFFEALGRAAMGFHLAH